MHKTKPEFSNLKIYNHHKISCGLISLKSSERDICHSMKNIKIFILSRNS